MPSAEFLLTSLIVVLVPGTGVIYTVSTGLFSGRRLSIAAATGCTLGIVPHLLACVAGLSAILHMSAMAFQTLKFAGAAYLLYLSWTMWRASDGLQFDRSDANNSCLQIVVRGILINILNPKLTIFFLAFLPLFVSSEGGPVKQMLMLGAVFMAMTFMVFVIYGVAAGSVKAYVLKSPRFIRGLRQCFAAVFAMLAAKLALTES